MRVGVSVGQGRGRGEGRSEVGEAGIRISLLAEAKRKKQWKKPKKKCWKILTFLAQPPPEKCVREP